MDKLTAWYNDHIVAQWYKSAALIGGWLASLIVFAPDIVQFVFDHWDIFGGVALPTMSPEYKALILGVYVTFIAPPLRAWQQKAMQKAAAEQQATRVISKLNQMADDHVDTQRDLK